MRERERFAVLCQIFLGHAHCWSFEIVKLCVATVNNQLVSKLSYVSLSPIAPSWLDGWGVEKHKSELVWEGQIL